MSGFEERLCGLQVRMSGLEEASFEMHMAASGVA